MSYPEPVDPTPKRLIICCDGTWQSAVTGEQSIPSNVTRLARLAALAAKDSDGKVWQQVVYYHADVGTGALSTLEVDRQGATGDGLIINVIDCYNFVVNNYNPGDQIFCFGFSRGAFTARAVAGLITDIGVLKPEQMKRFPVLWSIYKKNTAKHNFRKTREYYEFLHGAGRLVPKADPNKEVFIPFWERPNQDDPTWGEDSRIVELVGVFDTVGSLGLADFQGISNAWSRRRFQFLNVGWNPYIKHVFHALALDERRGPFSPSLYYVPSKKTVQKGDDLLNQDTDWKALIDYRHEVDRLTEVQRAASPPDLRQVWFTGYHVNVGGGNTDSGLDHEGLANITMAWMIEQCRPYLGFDKWALDECRTYIYNVIVEESEAALRKKSEAGPGVVAKVSQLVHGVEETFSHLFGSSAAKPEMVMSLNTKVDPSTQPPKLKDCRWVMFQKQDPYNAFYAAMNAPVVRKPGEGWDQTLDPHPMLKDLGETYEWIHPSVSWRVKVSHAAEDKAYSYTSQALKGFEHTKNEHGAHGWHKKATGTWIPEWPIRTSGVKDVGAEVHLISGCSDEKEVKAHLDKLNADWNRAEVAGHSAMTDRTRTAPK